MYAKIRFCFIAAVFTVACHATKPYVLQGTLSPLTLANVIEATAENQNMTVAALTEIIDGSGDNLAHLNSAIASYNGDLKLSGALAGFDCDSSCAACVSCGEAWLDVDIDAVAAMVLATIACFLPIVGPAACAGAYATALTTVAALAAHFCNQQGQGVVCNNDCAWAVCSADGKRMIEYFA